MRGGDQLGTVEPGKLADLIVVEANPLEDIRNLRRLLLVLKEGRIVSDKRRRSAPEGRLDYSLSGPARRSAFNRFRRASARLRFRRTDGFS